MSDLEMEVSGIPLVLLADRAIFLPQTGSLIVADVHWGKTATFRAAAIPIPPGTTSTDLSRLSDVIRRTAATRLVVLGDLLHARTWKAPQTRTVINAWRREHASLPITLIRGNHDVRAGGPTPDLDIESCNEPQVLDGLYLCHRPCDHEDGYTLAGHVHPCFNLYGAGRQHERLPCFLFGQRLGLLPAFGSFTGMAPVQPAATDRLFVIAGDTVVKVELD